VLASTKMAGGGETVEVTFTAPKEPGEYLYICTFPGHYLAGMKGVLVVK
jgi:azurin